MYIRFLFSCAEIRDSKYTLSQYTLLYAFNKVKIIQFFRLLTTTDYYLDTLQAITKPTEFDAG